MRLRNNERLFALPAQNQEFNRLFLETTGLAILRDHQCTLGELGLGPENVLCFLGVVKVFKVEANDILVVVGSLVSLLSLSVVLLSFFCLGYKNQDAWGGDLLDKRCGCLEHADLYVDTGGFLNEFTFLVEFGSLSPLLHLFADSGDLDDECVVVEFVGDVESSLNVAHLDGSARDASIALSVVLLDIDLLVVLFVWVEECLLVEFLSLDSVALVLDLTGQLSAYVLFLLGGDLFAEFEGGEPVLQVHAHL